MPLQLTDGATQEDPPECGTLPSNRSSMTSSELFFSRRRRRCIIREPKGLFPRRLLCLDEVGAQNIQIFPFFLLNIITHWQFSCTYHHSGAMHHLCPHAVSSPAWRQRDRARGTPFLEVSHKSAPTWKKFVLVFQSCYSANRCNDVTVTSVLWNNPLHAPAIVVLLFGF